MKEGKQTKKYADTKMYVEIIFELPEELKKMSIQIKEFIRKSIVDSDKSKA